MSKPASSVLPAVIDPAPFSEAELFALAGFLAGYSGLTYEAYALICVSTPAIASPTASVISKSGARISNALAATSKLPGKHEPRSRDGCAPSPASTATPNKKV